MGGAPTRWAENSHKAVEAAYGVESPVAVQIRTGRRFSAGVQFEYEYRSGRRRRTPGAARLDDQRVPRSAIAAVRETSRTCRRIAAGREYEGAAHRISHKMIDDAVSAATLGSPVPMVITYRRTGGLFAPFTLAAAAAALAATVLTVAVAGTLLIVSAAIAAVALFGRAVLPRRWRRRTVPPVTRWPHRTIDATVVNATGSSDTLNLGGVHENIR